MNTQLPKSPAASVALRPNSSQREEFHPQLNLDGPATWDTVKYWADLSAKFQHASVAAQVMAGFGLLELHKTHAIQPGNPRPETGRGDQLPNDLGIERPKWADLVKQEAGISDETARNWMKMAAGIKSKWKKLAPQARIKELMAVSPTEWNEADTKLVSDSLHKVTDGQTQLEFMRDLGLAKKPTTGNPHPKPRVSDQQKADIEDPLLFIENDLISITDEKDLTFTEVKKARLAKFRAHLKACLDRADRVLAAK